MHHLKMTVQGYNVCSVLFLANDTSDRVNMTDDRDSEKKDSEMMEGTVGAPKPPTDWIHPGSHFGTRYEILGVLGEGGMGRVYHAYDRELDRHVALKLIRESISSEPVILERFKREIQLASKITHKNILRIYDLGDIDGTKYVSMNFVRGKDLHKIIKREGALPLKRTIAILEQLCQGLKAAHDEGVLHRDLKPQNIMIDEKENAFITDFGLARSLDNESSQALTATGMVPGTPMYMSPEQIKGEGLDRRSDIYSLGLILYEMVTGTFPFPAPSNYASLIRRTQERPENPRKIKTDIPKYLAAVVMKCLENDPDLRYQDTSEILNDLVSQEVHTTTMLRVRSTIRKRWKAAAILLMIAIPTLLLLMQKPPPSEIGTQSLAVLPFVHANDDPASDWMRAGLQELLIGELHETDHVYVISSNRLQQTLRGLSVGSSDKELATTVLEQISIASSAKYILAGSFEGKSDSLQAKVRVYYFGEKPEVAQEIQATGSISKVLEELTSKIRKQTGTDKKRNSKQTRTYSEMMTARSASVLKPYYEGLSLLRQERFQEAIDRLELALKEDPQFYPAQAELAFAYSEEGESGLAQKAAQAALQSTNSIPEPETYRLQALLASLNDNDSGAIAAYKKLQDVYPDDPESYEALGRFYSEREDWNPAADQYKKAIELDGKNARYLMTLGRIELKMGNNQAGISNLTEALTLSSQLASDDERASLLNMMGIAYRRMEYFESALEHYQKALQIRKRMNDSAGIAMILGNMSQVYFDLGRYEDARQGYLEALAIAEEQGDRRQEARMLNDLGFLAERACHLDDALTYYNRALQAARSDRAVEQITNRLNNIGWIYYLTGRFTDAATYYELAFKEIGDSNPGIKADVLETYGTLLADQGEYRKSIDFYSQGQQIRRDAQDKSGEVLFLSDLAHTRMLIGAYEEAKKNLEEAIHLSYEISDNTISAFLFLVQSEFLRQTGEISTEPIDKAVTFAKNGKDEYMTLLVLIEKGTLLNEMNRWDQSIPLLEDVVQKVSAIGLKPLLPGATRELARAYAARNRFEDARKQMDQGVAVAEQLNLVEDILQIHLLAAAIENSRGPSESALRHYRAALRAADRLRKETRDAYSGSFVKRRDIQELLKHASEAFQSAGKEKEFEPYSKWSS